MYLVLWDIWTDISYLAHQRSVTEDDTPLEEK